MKNVKQVNLILGEANMIRLYVPENMTDEEVLDTIKTISAEFCKTPIGKQILEQKGSFSYDDFAMYVSNTICEKYSILKLDSCTERYIEVSADTTLINL